MRSARVHQGAKHHLTAAGAARLSIIKNPLNLLTLLGILTATQIAADNRILHGTGKLLAIGLGNEGHGPITEKIASLVQKVWRHGGQPPPRETGS